MASAESTRQTKLPGTVLRSPGLWLLAGGLELLFLVHLAEFLYPDYSVSGNYISDLGVGPMPSSAIFTAAVILFGLMGLLAAAFLRQRDERSLTWLFVGLSGIGAIGVGAFNSDYSPPAHSISAFLAFFFGNLAPLSSFRMARPPVSRLFAILGLIGLSALALFGADIYLGLGAGGMERMILYPAMFWTIAFGAYLMASEKRTKM